MHEQQGQFTTGLQHATKENRGPDDFPRLTNCQPKNQTPGRILENIDEASIHKKERSIAQSTFTKKSTCENEIAPNIGEGQQQGQKNMPSSQNVDDQPRDQQTTICETLHAYPRIVRKYQQT